MLENTLLGAISNLSSKFQFTELQKKKCNLYFSAVVIGDFIYAGQLKSKIYVDIKTSYLLLEELRKLGFLINLYEVYCKECSRSKGIFLNEITDLKTDTCCDFCNAVLEPLKDIIVLYKVVAI